MSAEILPEHAHPHWKEGQESAKIVKNLELIPATKFVLCYENIIDASIEMKMMVSSR